jgi:hypothetical protein
VRTSSLYEMRSEKGDTNLLTVHPTTQGPMMPVHETTTIGGSSFYSQGLC